MSIALVRQGPSWRRLARATSKRRGMVGIEVGTWRSGRIGGAAGSTTAGKAKRSASFGLRWNWGGGFPQGEQEAVGGDSEAGVVVEAWSTLALVVA